MLSKLKLLAINLFEYLSNLIPDRKIIFTVKQYLLKH